jgi:hypothetical protein
VVHPSVSRVVLHGSRGLAGGHRTDSDIDLSLIVDSPQGKNMESRLQAVLATTLHQWQSAVEPDLAVIFDLKQCGLKCFEQPIWDEQLWIGLRQQYDGQ